MAYFNDTNNTNFYSTPFASGGFYSYPHPTQTFVTDTEEANGQIYADSTDQWSAVRSGPMVGSPTSVRATDSFESLAPTTPYTSGSNGYSWPSYDQSADYRQIQSHHYDFLSRDGSFASTTASETSTAMHTPSSGEYSLEEFGAHRSQTVPLDYWGSNQSGASTSTSYMENANTSHWPMTAPTRTEAMPTGWYQPYGVSRTRPTRYRNAEAGPSTMVAPLVPYINPPISRPSGGISETSADAETTKKITEEDRAPRQKPKRARLPRGQGKPRPSRIRSGGIGHKLCECVQRRNKLVLSPTLNQALAAALEIIKDREPVYLEPRLKTVKGERTVKGSKNADNEYRRRDVERRTYQELSKYYRLPERKKEWTRPPLLVKVLRELMGVDKPPS